MAAGRGIGFVLASAIAFLIVPDPPTADEGSEFILNFVAVNDADLLWQAFFFGIGGVLLLWFGGTLAAALRRLGRNPDDRLPAVITASAGAAVAMFLVGVICVGALASGIEQMDQGVAYGLYQVGSFAFVMTDFPAAAFVWGPPRSGSRGRRSCRSRSATSVGSSGCCSSSTPGAGCSVTAPTSPPAERRTRSSSRSSSSGCS